MGADVVDRWSRPDWIEAALVVADPNCTKQQFNDMVGRLYPQGGETIVLETLRGRAEFYDFRGIDLSEKDLSGVDFVGFDLSAGKLMNVSLAQSRLISSRLEQTDFSNCVGGHTRFDGCFARAAIFVGADVVQSDFSGDRSSRSNFRRVAFAKVQFRWC